jgi:DNA-binding GntR family transcriptional regulator
MEPPGDQRISLPSVTDVIYKQLRRDISRGVYRPGPINLKALAERFGTSVIPVREALRRLEAEGLVSFDGRRRIVINGLDVKEMDELFAVRAELETLALRLAVNTLRDDDDALTELADLIALMDEQEDDPVAWRDTNVEFHARMYAAAQSPRLESIIGSLWVANDPYLRIYVTSVQSLRLAQQQHREILAAVRSGDSDRAQILLREHLSVTWRFVLDRMTRYDPQTQGDDDE